MLCASSNIRKGVYVQEATIGSALGTAFTTAVSDIMSAIGTVLPIVLPVLGAIAVIGVGIKIFKKVTGR